MLLDIDVHEHRVAESEVAPFILERWSPSATVVTSGSSGVYLTTP